MRAEVRRKVGMAEGVSDFCRAHPSDNALYNAALDGLEAALAEVKAKQGTQLAEIGAEHMSVTAREHFRDWIVLQFRVVPRIAKAIDKSRPGFALAYRLPKSGGPHLRFLSGLRALAKAGEENLPAFVAYGLPESFFGDMRRELDRFEELLAERKAALTGHIAAKTVQAQVLARMMAHADDLDAINTVRFRNDPELLATWKVLSRVPSGRRKSKAAAAKAAAAEAAPAA